MANNGSYVLHYFNLTGRGEQIRWILAYGRAKWEDRRFAKEEWPSLKAQQPIGQVPVLEWTSPDGKQKATVVQSAAIVTHLAQQFGINGKTPLQQAKALEAYECIRDLQETIFRSMYEPDAAKKAEGMKKIATETAPRILGYLEKRLKENSNKNLAGGDGLTHADIVAACFYEVISKMPLIDFNAICPTLAAHAKTVMETPDIKTYLAKRPKTEF